MPKRQVLSFVGLSFLISWSIWLAPTGSTGSGMHLQVAQYSLGIPWAAVTRLLGNIGPGLAAIILVAVEGGRTRIRALLMRLAPWRARPQWYFVAILLPVGITVAAMACLKWPAIYRPDPESLGHWIGVFLANVLFGPLMEEIGWRGYLLPGVQLSHSGFASAILVGLIWAPWHLPLFWSVNVLGSTRTIFLAWYLVYVLGLSVILTWIYNATRESLAITITTHAATDASAVVLLGPMMAASGIRPFIFVTVAICATGVGILLLTGLDLAYAGR